MRGEKRRMKKRTKKVLLQFADKNFSFNDILYLGEALLFHLATIYIIANIVSRLIMYIVVA